MKYLAVVLTLTLAGLHSQETAAPASVVGIWQMKVRQGERTLEFTLELKLEGGALGGKITEPGGRVRDIRNAGLSGNVLRFSVETDNRTMQAEARLEGETLTGTYTGPGDDRGAWEGKRGKERNPFDSVADVEIGRKYFLGHCAHCHGPEGEGGRGVNLTTGQYRHGGLDRDLFRTIQNGVPGTEMSGTGLSDNEIWRITAYVRRLASAGAGEKASGDAAAGRVVYQTRGGCAQCHVVENQGGVLGPELSDVGLRRSLKFLRQALLEPDAYVADNYRTVAVTTRSGEQISGIRLNEDEYSIQLRDTRADLRSLLKRNLKDWKRETRSLMPAYGSTLSPAELDNLVAYLNSLRRKP